MHRSVQVSLTRAILILATMATLFIQVVILPSIAHNTVLRFPDTASMQWPMLVTGVAFLACFEVGYFCCWKLLGRYENNKLFNEATLPWTSALLWCQGLATCISACLLAIFVVRGTGPISVPILLLAITLSLTLLFLFTSILRTILKNAVNVQAELDVVV